MAKVSIIAAIDRNNGIGKDGQLPWKLPSDLKHFKETTTGSTIVCGRKTFESMGALPNRSTVVLSRRLPRDPHKPTIQKYTSIDNVFIARSLNDAIVDHAFNYYIVGGGEVYKDTINNKLVNELIISHVDASVDCDVFFPEIDLKEWGIVNEITPIKNPKDEFDYTIKYYKRKPIKITSENLTFDLDALYGFYIGEMMGNRVCTIEPYMSFLDILKRHNYGVHNNGTIISLDRDRRDHLSKRIFTLNIYGDPIDYFEKIPTLEIMWDILLGFKKFYKGLDFYYNNSIFNEILKNPFRYLKGEYSEFSTYVIKEGLNEL